MQQQQQRQERKEAGADAMDVDQDDASAPDAAPEAQQSAAGAASAGAAGAPTPATGGQGPPPPPGARQGRQQRRRPEPNPFRNLGDALERWKANLNVTSDAKPAGEGEDAAERGASEEPPPGAGGADREDEPPPAAEYQFLGEGERPEKGATQALAPATTEQAQPLPEGEAGARDAGREEGDDGAGDDGGGAPEAMDEEEDGGPDAPAPGVAPRSWAGSQRAARAQQPPADDAAAATDSDAEGGGAAGEAGPLDGDAGADGGGAPDDERLDSLVTARLAHASLEDGSGDGAADGGPPPPPARLSEEEAAAIRAQLDERMREAAAGGGAAPGSAADEAHGRRVWAACEALTAGLAAELTEQLRLILEPTAASRLAGDYRTGKRINMKKVIAYIASSFRRDKIWLRRTRPDKRRYQVLLAVDDSRSMAENGCGGFALEALTLISRALSRLEVGELGVLSFGGAGGVRPLQPLEAPFTDAVGPGLVSALRFDQDNTIQDRPMEALMAALSHALDGARHRAGAGGIGAGTADLHQLVLVLADGRFHEKEGLAAAVREAAEKRGVCLAFIALDSAAAPLAEMQTVAFAGGKPVFTRYLDAFPFPYYILLRDIAALPRTLADLLRQWMEMSAR